MLLTTLRTHENMVAASEVGGISRRPKPDSRLPEITEKLIAEREGKFDPSTFKDRYEDGAFKERAGRFLERKKGEAAARARPKTKKSALQGAHAQEG